MGVILTDCDDWLDKVLGVQVIRDDVLAKQATAAGPAKQSNADEVTALMKRLATVIAASEKDGIDTRGLRNEQSQFDTYIARAKSVPNAEGQLGKLVPKIRHEVAQAEQDRHRQSQSEVGGASRAVIKLRNAAAHEIKKLPDKDKLKAEFQTDLKELDAAIAAAHTADDRKTQAKLLAEADDLAQHLFNDVGRAAKDQAGVQKAYKEAIQERFGIKIDNSDKLKNTHFDGLYKMLGKVPLSDVVQGKFAKVEYKKPAEGEEVAAFYDETKISFPEIEAGDEMYTDPKTGKAVACNAFNVTTLHELGHSVDDRFSVMKKGMGRAGAGNWKSESQVSTAMAFALEFLKKEAKGMALKPVLALVTEALTDGAPTDCPDGVTPQVWQALAPRLMECAKVRQSESPWDNGTPVIVPGRGYHQAYDDEWYSYDAALRSGGTMTVNAYQWRSPWEFFAELYAFTWMQERPPPTGTDATLAIYLWSGKKAQAANPAAVKGH